MDRISEQPTQTPQELLQHLFQIARLSREPSHVLQAQGWDAFFSFRPFERSGAPNVGDIEIALAEIPKEAPQVLGDWEVLCALSDAPPAEGIYDLLRRKTEQRKIWDKEMGQKSRK